MDFYREAILDHYKHPHNFGHLKNPDVTQEEGNVTCGDKIIMEIKMNKDKIKEIAFSGEGCAISQASASMLTERVQGMRVKDIMNISLEDIIDMLGTTLTPSRVKCATLPLEVLQKAIQHQSSEASSKLS